MNIKNGHSSFLARLIGGCLILLCGLIATGWLIKSNNNSSNLESLKESMLTENQSAFLKQRRSFIEVVDYFNDHIIYLGVKDEASFKMSSEFRKWLELRKGTELSKLKFREAYVGKIVDGEFVEEYREKDKSVVLKDNKFTITSSPQGQGNYCRFSVGNNKFEQINRGISIYIVDKSSQLVAEYSFDFYKFEEPRVLGKKLLGSNTNLKKVRLVLSKADFLKVKNKRDEAVKTQILLVGDEDLVNAKIETDDKTYPAKIRLKGDWIDHLKGDKWSFRVKLEGDQMINGMKKFSLHTPAARNYAGEWLFHEVLKGEDILHLKYSFVEVLLNIEGEGEQIERNLGVYAMEEFFEKQLIERNERREGVILKLNEDLLWQKRAEFFDRDLPLSMVTSQGWERVENFPITPFGQKRVLQDSVLFKQFLTAKNLFQGYLDGELKINEVFDVNRLAKYNAICNLLGAHHGLIFHNQRFYYNPLNSKLEPIGFDGNALNPHMQFVTYRNGANDSLYMMKYIQELDQVATKKYIEQVVNWPGLDNVTEMLMQEFEDYEWSVKVLWKNLNLIRSMIDPIKSLNVYVASAHENSIFLSVDNFGPMPITLKKLEHTDGQVIGYPKGSVLINPNERKTFEIELERNYDRLFVKKKRRKSNFNVKTDISQIKLIYSVLGMKEEKSEQIMPWNIEDRDIAKSDLFRDKPNVEQFKFLVRNEENKTIRCKPGIWEVHMPIIIPEGYTLIISPGTELLFVSIISKIISFSPVQFIGTPEKPIIITSLKEIAQGVAVINASDTSIIRHCKFNKLTNPRTKGWALTGAVNFYESPVKIQYTEFTNNYSEDALNIFKGWFEMDQAYFNNTKSDAFDGDFVEGTVSNTVFEQIGNDGIDVSGSKLLVENVVVSDAGDKGISAGEGSTVIAYNIGVKDSEVALASKDNSRLEVSQVKLTRNKLGMTAFQKKPEFGPAHIVIDSLKVTDNQELHLIEHNSSCLIDSSYVPTVDKVKEQMYGVNYGKSSK